MKYLYTLFAISIAFNSYSQVNKTYTVYVPSGTNEVMMTGPWWEWNDAAGAPATELSDGVWQLTIDQEDNIANPNVTHFEYLWVVDGVREDLIDNAADGGCANRIDAGELNTDYFSYANRKAAVDVDVVDNAYGTCSFLTSTDFETDASLRGWEGIGDGAITAEASITRVTTGGNTGGALALYGKTPGAGKNYQFRVVDADYNYFNGGTVTVSFDAKKDTFVNGDIFFNINSTRENLTATITNTWQNFSFDVDVSPTNNVNELSLRFELITGAIVDAGGTVLVDNLSITTSGTAAPPAVPTDAPTTPPARDAADVISIYGEAYVAPIGVTDVTWDGGSSFVEESIASNNVMKISFNEFIGLDLSSYVDATTMTHMHMDIWIRDAFAAGQVFKPKWSNHEGQNGETAAFDYTHAVAATDSESWVSIDVALDDFVQAKYDNNGAAIGNGPADRMALKQLVISVAETLDVVYVDNIYLYKDSTASIGDLDFNFEVYPNPVKEVLNVISAESIEMVKIYDLTGSIVKQATPKKANFDLDVADLSNGVYLVKLNAGNKEVTTKLIK